MCIVASVRRQFVVAEPDVVLAPAEIHVHRQPGLLRLNGSALLRLNEKMSRRPDPAAGMLSGAEKLPEPFLDSRRCNSSTLNEAIQRRDF